jgi:hypothetical protein
LRVSGSAKRGSGSGTSLLLESPVRANEDKRADRAQDMVATGGGTPDRASNRTDPGMLDIVGFDTATPQLISDFARGSP